jgi:hypothetical protein
MLKIKKTAVSLDEAELMQLEQIITDQNAGEALKFLKKTVYDQIVHLQTQCLKSHLDTSGSPVDKFKESLQ